MEEPFVLVWGLISADDLTGAGCSIDTMNDIELIYHTDTKDYSVDVEMAYSFKNHEAECEYLRTLLKAFTDWMNREGYPTDHRFHPFWHFSEGVNINTQFKTIPEAYANFKLLVNGFCAEEQYYREKAAQSLFGILPPDAKDKRFYTQEEVEQELGLDKKELENLDDIEFE